MKPKVSIIVPCYGVEKYLHRCLDSLINQTLHEIEIILVDDKSPDNVPQMCDEWAKRDKRIKVIHKMKNEGLGMARNSGLEIATGEYIAFVDSDDYVELSMYKTLYATAKKNKCDVVYSGFYKQLSNNVFKRISECNVYTEYEGNEVKELIPDFIASEPYCRSEYKHDMSVWHSIYNNNIIKYHNIEFVSERIYASEDILFQLDILSHVFKVAFIPNNLYYYCYNGNSLTKTVDVEKFERIKNLFYLLIEKTKVYDPNGLRTKRLFIGYTRALFRKIIKSQMSKDGKNILIKKILQDNIWVEIKKTYKLKYLPLKQRLLTIAIYRGNVLFSKLIAYLMEIKKPL